jgi:hypothetical protein
MKCFPVFAVSVCVASLAACSIKEERVVQPAPAPLLRAISVCRHQYPGTAISCRLIGGCVASLSRTGARDEEREQAP